MGRDRHVFWGRAVGALLGRSPRPTVVDPLSTVSAASPRPTRRLPAGSCCCCRVRGGLGDRQRLTLSPLPPVLSRGLRAVSPSRIVRNGSSSSPAVLACGRIYLGGHPSNLPGGRFRDALVDEIARSALPYLGYDPGQLLQAGRRDQLDGRLPEGHRRVPRDPTPATSRPRREAFQRPGLGRFRGVGRSSRRTTAACAC